MAKEGQIKSGTMRTNNFSNTGYGIVYADEVIGHRRVDTFNDLIATGENQKVFDWQLKQNNDTTGDTAIGQMWYVKDEDCYYILENWVNRRSASGWKKFETDIDDISIEEIKNLF